MKPCGGFPDLLEEGADGFHHASERATCRVADCAEQSLPQG